MSSPGIKQTTEYFTRFPSGVGAGEFVPFSSFFLHKPEGGSFVSFAGDSVNMGEGILSFTLRKGAKLLYESQA